MDASHCSCRARPAPYWQAMPGGPQEANGVAPEPAERLPRKQLLLWRLESHVRTCCLLAHLVKSC